MKQCSLCFGGIICTCGKQNENVVLILDMLRGKNLVGEKVLSIVALIVYVPMQKSFDLKFMCLCLGKKKQKGA